MVRGPASGMCSGQAIMAVGRREGAIGHSHLEVWRDEQCSWTKRGFAGRQVVGTKFASRGVDNYRKTPLPSYHARVTVSRIMCAHV
jgi:hypothetical protein